MVFGNLAALLLASLSIYCKKARGLGQGATALLAILTCFVTLLWWGRARSSAQAGAA